jgi:hypothetical protein
MTTLSSEDALGPTKRAVVAPPPGCTPESTALSIVNNE